MASRIPIHCAEDIAMARRAARLAADILCVIEPYVVPGVSTEALDQICHEHIVNVQDAIPANLGYQGYPKTILTSVNQVICHGIPSPRKILKNGDIVNIDVAVIKDGWFGDTSRMFFVGAPSVLARRLVQTTYEAMRAGIRQSSSLGQRWAISAMPSSRLLTGSTSAWYAIFAGTVLVRFITMSRPCCITDSAARD